MLNYKVFSSLYKNKSEYQIKYKINTSLGISLDVV